MPTNNARPARSGSAFVRHTITLTHATPDAERNPVAQREKLGESPSEKTPLMKFFIRLPPFYRQCPAMQIVPPAIAPPITVHFRPVLTRPQKVPCAATR